MKFNKSTGKVSTILLVLAIILIIVIVVVFIVLKINATRNSKNSNPQQNNADTTTNELPKPVYETTIGDIRLLLQSSQDLGNVLKSQNSYQYDVKTTERFIRVVIAAQNKGKKNTGQYAWSIGNIIDSEGRNFIPSGRAYYFLPSPDLCGAVLEPEFEPIPCTKMYEVSRVSTGLKIEVFNTGVKKQPELIYLKINQ